MTQEGNLLIWLMPVFLITLQVFVNLFQWLVPTDMTRRADQSKTITQDPSSWEFQNQLQTTEDKSVGKINLSFN